MTYKSALLDVLRTEYYSLHRFGLEIFTRKSESSIKVMSSGRVFGRGREMVAARDRDGFIYYRGAVRAPGKTWEELR